ncbi:MAG: ABC transporter ATP-binding protein [Alphaproteobacteria bacterium HGW-Alphaproteobacteria-6]|nr:MAG: ABC transporter ATP-binding protein [Alphaproteobacteria bacterium HGW-Alphaproteobacteria-6]
MLLVVDALSKSFGGLKAIQDLSFTIRSNEIHGLIGPNGAGKTTTFNLISGFYKPTSGQIVFDGRDIAGMNIHHIAKLGIVRTFQATTVFKDFTVLQNVVAGRHMHTHYNILTALVRSGADGEFKNERRAIEILDIVGLGNRLHESAGSLSHGHQKVLGLAIALAAEPRLLLLDEPFAGMNSEETNRMIELIRKVREHGISIVLVEHDMHAVMSLCDRITVLNFGRFLADGPPEKVVRNEAVIEAYLGGV